MSAWGQHSRCAGLAARSTAALTLAALPGSARVVGRVKGGQPPFVAAADLTQDLQPLAGLHAVSRLDVQRLLRVHHLEHLTEDEHGVTLQSAPYRHDPLCPRKFHVHEKSFPKHNR